MAFYRILTAVKIIDKNCDSRRQPLVCSPVIKFLASVMSE